MAKGRIQNEDIKSMQELIDAGGFPQQLPNDSKIWLSARDLGKTLEQAILDGELLKGPTVVDLFDDTLTTLPLTTATLVDGETIVDGDIVLFTAFSNPVENNRIYSAAVDMGNITWTIVKLNQHEDGDPLAGDFVFVTRGTSQFTLFVFTTLWEEFKSGGVTGESALLNNQTTPADVDGFLIDSSENKAFKAEYSISRIYQTVGGQENTTLTDQVAQGDMRIWGHGFTVGPRMVVTQADGKVIIGGNFLDYGNVFGRSRLIRLNTDGTVDDSFCVNASDGNKFNDNIWEVRVQSDGKILVGGDFTNYAGTSGRNRLVRLNSDGTLDTAFCANAVDGTKFSSIVYVIREDDNNKLVVGGSFINYAGTTGRNILIRLNNDGTLDTTFTSNASDGAKFNALVRGIAIDSVTDQIIIGGDFTNYDSTTDRNRVIRLNDDGTLDVTYTSNAADGNKFSGGVRDIYLDSAGKAVIGGDFTNYAGTSGRNRLVKLNTDGTTDTTFTSNAADGSKFSAVVWRLYMQSDDKVLAMGDFISYGGISARNKFIRLNADGTLDTTFTSNASDSNKFQPGRVYAATVHNTDKVAVVGEFTDYGPTGGQTIARNYGISLNNDGTVNTSYVNNAFDQSLKFFSVGTNKTTIQPDGKIIVCGDFINYGNVSGRSKVIRLNTDGTVDTTFTSNASDGAKFNALAFMAAIQSDGKILVGGDFTNYAGTSGRNRLVRLNSDGTLDTAFCANAVDGSKISAVVRPIVVQSDGKVIIGGNFTNYNGVTNRNRVLRLNDDGTTDTTFATNAVDSNKFNSAVLGIALDSSENIYVSGSFTDYAGTTGRHRLVKLNPDGTTDTTFTSNASDGAKFGNGNNWALTIQDDDKVITGGDFINYAGTSGRNRLVRLNPDGTLDTTFTSNAADSNKINTGTVQDVHILSNGKVTFCGSFISYGGVSGRDRLVRTNPDGTLDTTFMSNAVDGFKFKSTVTGITSAGTLIYVSGQFYSYADQGAQNYWVALDDDSLNEVLSQGAFSGLFRPSSSAWELGGFTLMGDTHDVILTMDSSGQLKYETGNISGNEVESLMKYQILLL